jgi:hypothetical protein
MDQTTVKDQSSVIKDRMIYARRPKESEASLSQATTKKRPKLLSCNSEMEFMNIPRKERGVLTKEMDKDYANGKEKKMRCACPLLMTRVEPSSLN